MKTQTLIWSLMVSLAHFSPQISAEDVKRSDFPDGFLFGTSTSAYQVEGAFVEDGKGLNNWDVFSHISGAIRNDENGDVADDHYHRFLEDIEMLHSLGVSSYRFSISWARILPRGRFGNVNENGVKFYNTIINNLVLRGIEPFVTIHHHDIPQELEDRYMTWLSPQIQEDFVHFANVCFTSFGDRVKYWTTINEPNLFTEMAYIRGWYPPARCSQPFGDCPDGNSDTEPLVVMHNMILSHAKAVKLYREHFQKKQGGVIGIIANTFMYEPYTDDEFNRQAVARALAYNVAWLMDPIVHGEYPPEMRQYHGIELPTFSPKETMFVKGSLDFIGINHYSTLYAKDCIHSACNATAQRPIRGFVDTMGVKDGVPIGEPTGMTRFFVVPGGLEKTIDYIKDRYNNMPAFVTENGYSPAVKENENLDDLLQDEKRVDFHKAYLATLARSIRKGGDVRGYFVWSLMDNFEWIQGYSMRFGLYHVDRRTMKRTTKLSAKWYQTFLANCTTSLEDMSKDQKIKTEEKIMEMQGIEPCTSRMQSERSTI